MKPTEQQDYCVVTAGVASPLKIEACAGGGKTSTLKLIAAAYPLKSLYMAFNKVTAVEAEAGFPRYVTCKTTHSLAYGAFGSQLNDKLSRPRGRYVNVAGTGSEIAKYYNLDGVEGKATANAVGLYVRKCVESFEQSAAENMTINNVPYMEKLQDEPQMNAYVLKWAKRLWADRCDLRSPVLATHDTYLKLYQLSKPVLSYEMIFLDEAQDTTPCVLDIFMRQATHAKLVMVGDRRQAIYGWRGAVNAMASIRCAEAPLSMSFRYGAGIAQVATAVLHQDMVISGRPDLKSFIGEDVVDRTKPYMYLFRTNAELLMQAVAAVDRGERVAIEIDVKDFVKVLQSAQALFYGPAKDVKHERILPYVNWKAMKEEADEQGGELKRLVNIVEGGMGPHIIDVLEHYQTPPNAIATYTTAHKAKGREAQQVILADDFPSNYKKDEFVGLPEHEANLLYVAVTRSQCRLQINSTLREIMDEYNLPYDGDEWKVKELEPSYNIQRMFGKKATLKADNMLRKMIRSEAKAVDNIIHGGGEMRGEMAIEAMHREMGYP